MSIKGFKQYISEMTLDTVTKKIGGSLAQKASDLILAYSDQLDDARQEKLEKNLNWKSTKPYSAQEVLKVMSIIPGSYNGFNRVVLKKLLDYFPDAKYYPARERSVCLYIVTDVGLDEGQEKQVIQGCNIDEFDVLDAVQARKAGIDFNEKHESVVRVWWD